MSMNIEKLSMPVNTSVTTDYDQAQTKAPDKVTSKSQGNTLDNKKNTDKDKKDGDGSMALDKDRGLSKDTLNSAFSNMNSKLKMQRTRCEYDYDETTNRVSIKVYNKDTDELVIESPPEESIEAFKKTLELAGIIVDKKS